MQRAALALLCACACACSSSSASSSSDSVRVRVLRGGLPRPGALVVFHDANGAVIETQEVPNTGTVTSTSGAAEVTVAVPIDERQAILVTYFDVAPNDHLVVDTKRSALAGTPPLGPAVRSIRVAAPGEVPGAKKYAVDAFGGTNACSGFADGWTDVRIDLAEGCFDGPRTNLLARAFAETGSPKALRYAPAKKVTLQAPGATPYAIPGPWLDPMQISVRVENAPAGLPLPVLSLLGIIENKEVGIAEQGEPGTTTFEVPPAFYDEHVVTVRGGLAGLGSRYQVLDRATVAKDVRLDLAGLATIGVNLDLADPVRPVARISGAQGTVGGSVAFAWDGFPKSGKWVLVARADRVEMKAPELPAELRDWLPKGTSDEVRRAVRGYVARYVTGGIYKDYTVMKRQAVFADVALLIGDELLSYAAPPKGQTRMSLFEGEPK